MTTRPWSDPTSSRLRRSRRPVTWVAVALLVLSLAMIGFSLASLVLPGADRLPDPPDLAIFLAAVCVFVTVPTVGAILAILRPWNPIGWLFLALGVGFTMSIFSTEYVGRSVVLGADLPGHRLIDWIGVWVGTLSLGLAIVWIPLVFPDGLLPGPRWRAVAWGAGLTLVADVVGSAVTEDGMLPNPIALGGPLGDVARMGAGIPLLIFACLALVSLVVRFRRSRGIERQQLKWFLAAVGFLVTTLLVGVATEIQAVWYAVVLGLASLPVAAAFAILRYRLYEIDRIISRTIAYALVSTIVATVFGGVIVLLSAALASFAQGQTIAVAASTLAAFAIFQPVLHRVRKAVDMRFNRARYDAEQTVAEFSARLRDEVDIATVARDLDKTVQGAVKPASVRLWIREARS